MQPSYPETIVPVPPGRCPGCCEPGQCQVQTWAKKNPGTSAQPHQKHLLRRQELRRMDRAGYL